MSFYKESRKKIIFELGIFFPEAKALRHNNCVGEEDLPWHLLWMAEEMGKWDTTSIKRAVKAGRWIGWMYRAMEELGLFLLDTSREFSKKDVDGGYHLMH